MRLHIKTTDVKILRSVEAQPVNVMAVNQAERLLYSYDFQIATPATTTADTYFTVACRIALDFSSALRAGFFLDQIFLQQADYEVTGMTGFWSKGHTKVFLIDTSGVTRPLQSAPVETIVLNTIQQSFQGLQLNVDSIYRDMGIFINGGIDLQNLTLQNTTGSTLAGTANFNLTFIIQKP